MGWSSGSGVFKEAWRGIREYVPVNDRVEACKKLITALEDQDWDTQDEVFDSFPEVTEAMYELHPDWAEEEEDE